MVDYYKQLGIPSTASADEIKRAYRRLALKYHPDKNQGNKLSEEIFKLINKANQTLSDSKSRGAYDAAYNKAKANVGRKQLLHFNKGSLYVYQNKKWYKMQGRWALRIYKNGVHLVRISSSR